MGKLLTIIATAALATALAGCTGDGCLDNGSALPLAQFYVDDTQMSVNNLTVKGVEAPGDTLLTDDETVTRVYLPLRPTTTECKYVLDYNDENIVPDTITFTYTPVPTFVSHDCGAMFFFEMHDVNYTTHVVDSVAVLYPVIDNLDRVSVKIFMQE